MKKVFLLLPVIAMLFSCTGNNNNQDNGGYKPGRDYGDNKTYALFMLNYPRVVDESANGYQEKYDNALYQKVEIQVGELIPEPANEPQRAKYEFQGWHKDSAGTDIWNFEMDRATGSTFLYAKWGVSTAEEYVEPEYIPPERIITDMNYKVTGILNKPLKSQTEVELTAGAINRLKEHPTDVKFAVNYERKEDVTLDVATFDEATMTIHLEVSSGETWNIHVEDVTTSMSVAYASDYYETKAKNYEAKGKDIENYHVALGGSSSMENWSTSTEDMAPIGSFNHGIGGTTVKQWTDQLFERLIQPYSPKIVVYYVGVNNIINSGQSGTTCGRELKALFDKTHKRLPDAHIFYIMINKLPGYPQCQKDFDKANSMAEEYAAENNYLTCVDAGIGLLKENGEPHYGYFRPDGLHMSRYGYVIWGGAVKQAIMDYLG